jgi:hypothetical protein
VHGAREEGRTVLIELLEFQIGLDETLQNFVAVGAQRIGDQGLIVVGRNSESHKRRERRTGHRLQQNVCVDRGAASKCGQVLSMNQEQMLGGAVRRELRNNHGRVIIPQP